MFSCCEFETTDFQKFYVSFTYAVLLVGRVTVFNSIYERVTM